MTTRTRRRERSGYSKIPVLRARSDFLRVQSHGKRFRQRHLLLLVVPGTEGVRLGLTVSRKVGNAVVRNRVRRRLREIVRTHPDLLSDGWDYVIIAHPPSARAEFTTLREELTCLLDRARAWVSCKPSSSR